jgi:hypothetical protein
MTGQGELILTIGNVGILLILIICPCLPHQYPPYCYSPFTMPTSSIAAHQHPRHQRFQRRKRGVSHPRAERSTRNRNLQGKLFAEVAKRSKLCQKPKPRSDSDVDVGSTVGPTGNRRLSNTKQLAKTDSGSKVIASHSWQQTSRALLSR